MRAVLAGAIQAGITVVVPTVVLGEWWRGRSDLRDDLVTSVAVEPLSESLAKRAGEALAVVRGATFVDAVVMASAASRGDVVYTSDRADLERLHTHFTAVRRVLSV
jgi:predicted nucleic acid-binding protein